MKEKLILFITGASGVGKTTLITHLKEKYASEKIWHFAHFDSIGVPSPEEMKEQYGSGEEWQKAMTQKWVDNLINGYKDKEVLILEGQVNLQFIKDAFAKHHFTNYGIIHIDSSEEEMALRLTHSRKQPELVTRDMKNWLGFLRNQAKEFGVPIVDTSNKSEEKVLNEFEKVLTKFLH